MLLQFSVSNYRCFRKLQTLDFRASPKDTTLPENCISADNPGIADSRWVKGVALYGANASGKTTIIEAMEALAEMVKESAATTDPKEPIAQIQPFALGAETSGEPTVFAITFVSEGRRYEYMVAATRERILHESLRADSAKKQRLWFSRDWNSKTMSYLWRPERSAEFKRDEQLEGYTLPNMLFLSKAIASNRTDLEPVFRWFKDNLQFLALGAQSDLSIDFTQTQLERQTPLASEILTLLRCADLGVTDFKIEKRQPLKADMQWRVLVEELVKGRRPRVRPSRQSEIKLLHQGSGAEPVAMPWESESAGTHRFFALVGPWLDFIQKGRVLCVDELNTSMHPLMVKELLRLVFNKFQTQTGAQVIFTTHNPLLLDMNILRRDQIWFTLKNESGEGHLYPLTEYSPRKGESLIRGYMSGRYGAIPSLERGLLGNRPASEVLEEKAGTEDE